MNKYIPRVNIFDGEYFDLAIGRDRLGAYSDYSTSYEYDMVFRTNKKHNVINPPTTKEELLALADFIYDTVGE
jgi:hypothetical protein